MRLWPCYPSRRLHLLHVAKHLIDFVKIARPHEIGLELARDGHSERIQQVMSYRVDECRIIDGREVYMRLSTLITLRWDLLFITKWSITPALSGDEL